MEASRLAPRTKRNLRFTLSCRDSKMAGDSLCPTCTAQTAKMTRKRRATQPEVPLVETIRDASRCGDAGNMYVVLRQAGTVSGRRISGLNRVAMQQEGIPRRCKTESNCGEGYGSHSSNTSGTGGVRGSKLRARTSAMVFPACPGRDIQVSERKHRARRRVDSLEGRQCALQRSLE